MNTDENRIKQEKLGLAWDAVTTPQVVSDSIDIPNPVVAPISEVFDNFAKDTEKSLEPAEEIKSNGDSKTSEEESVQLSNGTTLQNITRKAYPLKTDLHTEVPKTPIDTVVHEEHVILGTPKPIELSTSSKSSELNSTPKPVTLGTETVKKVDVRPVEEKVKATSLLKQAEKRINNISFSIGHALEQARKLKGLELKDVAETTRIRLDIIVSIEKDDFDSAPAPVYTRGYIKKLADLYGTDGVVLVEHYNNMIAGLRKKKPVDSPKKDIPKVIDDLASEFSSISPAGVQPTVVSQRTSGSVVKKVVIVIIIIVSIIILKDLFSGNESENEIKVPEVKKETVVTTGVKPAIEIADLLRYSNPPKIETLKLDVPK